MKKVTSVFLGLFLSSLVTVAYATAGAADIRFNIKGATSNRYFLCMENVGCLSIAAGNKGKTYPILQPLKLTNMFITDAAQDLRVSAQGLPASCNITVPEGRTVTISGRIEPVANGGTFVKGLACSVD